MDLYHHTKPAEKTPKQVKNSQLLAFSLYVLSLAGLLLVGYKVALVLFLLAVIVNFIWVPFLAWYLMG